MGILLLTAVFILGAVIGSFLNVVIFRLRARSSIGGRSKCLACNKVLRWFELIPVISYLIQWGRCRRCKDSIAAQYPVVEILTGILFVLLAMHITPLVLAAPFAATVVALFGIVTICLLVVIGVYDWRHKIIPNELVYGFIALSVLSVFIETSASGVSLTLPPLLDALSGIILAAPFALLWGVSGGRLMGLGDVKLIVGIGYFLGFSAGIAALMLSFWIGALFAIVLLVHTRLLSAVSSRITMKSEVPFGPFLILAFFLAYFLNLTLPSLLYIFG